MKLFGVSFVRQFAKILSILSNRTGPARRSIGDHSRDRTTGFSCSQTYRASPVRTVSRPTSAFRAAQNR